MLRNLLTLAVVAALAAAAALQFRVPDAAPVRPGPGPAPAPAPQPAPAPCPGPGPCPRPHSGPPMGPAEYKIQAAGPELDGEQITVDLPAELHLKNVGGSDGAGLCVFTSGHHAAHWGNVRTLYDWRKWMQSQPGGGYPEKVDKMLAQYCREKGVPVPDYVQNTGGDMQFLELALRTGRMPCITYAGADGVYYGQTIAHMVNCVHLSPRWFVILDNNYPGKYLWLPRAEGEKRFKGHAGGWSYLFLNPPPPPVPVN